MALISSAIAQSLREQDLIPDALENLAKSSTRGATKPVQTSLPLKQTNLYYDSSRNDFFVKPENSPRRYQTSYIGVRVSSFIGRKQTTTFC